MTKTISDETREYKGNTNELQRRTCQKYKRGQTTNGKDMGG